MSLIEMNSVIAPIVIPAIPASIASFRNAF